jgi:hypothetical protein
VVRLLHNALRGDEACDADIADLGVQAAGGCADTPRFP